MNLFTRVFMYMYIFRPTSRGVNTLSAKKWFRKIHRDFRRNRKYSASRKLKAYSAGWLPAYMSRFGLDKESARDIVCERDYLYLQPINGAYSKWLDADEVTEKIFYPFTDYLKLGTDCDADGASDAPESRSVRIIVTNEKGYNPIITEVLGDNDVPCWDEVVSVTDKIARFAPQLGFFAADVAFAEDGRSFWFTKFYNYPEYPEDYIFSKETNDFLKKKLRESKERAANVKLRRANARERVMFKTRKLFTMAFFPKDLVPYLSVRWISEVTKDLFSNTGVSLGDKIWAYRHGFLSYRIPQYGITRENHLNFISDFEYKWLRHINGDYRLLFEDKITIKYIVNEFRECFPDYYYHIKTDIDENVIIPMMDCPEGYGRDYSDIIRLAKEKGVLALKPDEGSHGEGFYRLKYVPNETSDGQSGGSGNGDGCGSGGRFYLNFDEASEERVINLLSDTANQYLVTEYIDNHPQFKAIYDGAVNTARMIVFKEDGVHPVLGNAYLRFGSKQTGAVDNMGAGGIFVQVDIDTGRYHDAKIITHNSIIPCPVHPDTKVPLEGYIPHWEDVKKTVLAVAENIAPLEYFGFDVAITETGIKFPEINRFPDYPKIEKLSPITTKYLLGKLEQKKKRVGYDKHPCRKLVHLPKR